MKNKIYPFCLFIIVCFNISVFAQKNSDKKWTRIFFNKNETSVSLPPGFIVDATKTEFTRRYFISSFQNNIRMQVMVFEVVNTKDRIFGRSINSNKNIATFEKNNLTIKVRSSDAATDYFMKVVTVESPDFTYNFFISSPDKSAPEIERFLYSIQTKGENLFVNKNAKSFDDENVSASELKNSPEVDQAYERKLDTKKQINVTNQLSNEDDYGISYENYSRAPILIEQARLEFRPDRGGAVINDSSYSAKLKIKLLADGQIGDIVVLSNADKNFINACVRAARKLRFVPAQIDGKNADSVTIIGYSMQVFGSGVIMR